MASRFVPGSVARGLADAVSRVERLDCPPESTLTLPREISNGVPFFRWMVLIGT
jgi:hypothetical protein